MNHLTGRSRPTSRPVREGEPGVSFVFLEQCEGDRRVRRQGREFVPPSVARRLTGWRPEAPVARRGPRVRHTASSEAMDASVLIDKLDDIVTPLGSPLTDQVDRLRDLTTSSTRCGPPFRRRSSEARWIVKERQRDARRGQARVGPLPPGSPRAGRPRGVADRIVKLAERQAQEIVDDARPHACETRLETRTGLTAFSPRSKESGQVPRCGPARSRTASRALAGDGRRRIGPLRRRRRQQPPTKLAEPPAARQGFVKPLATP